MPTYSGNPGSINTDNPVYSVEKSMYDAKYPTVQRNKVTKTSIAAAKDIMKTIEARGGSPAEVFILHGFKWAVVQAAFDELRADEQAAAEAQLPEGGVGP
jgi:hypothetical protein